MRKFHPEIFNKSQAVVFPDLRFLKKRGFYLAGGTALALQLGHRTSVDLDFYTKKHFDTGKLYDEIEKVFGEETQKTLEEKDTLFCTVKRVDLSFFWYKYPLIRKTIAFKEIPLATLEDIAAMKLIAVSHRPTKRDYIDIFYLLEVFSLEDLFSFASKKYPNINLYFSMRALTYFDDIKEKDERPIKVLDKNFSWEKAKKEIFEEVRRYQLGMIKKK